MICRLTPGTGPLEYKCVDKSYEDTSNFSCQRANQLTVGTHGLTTHIPTSLTNDHIWLGWCSFSILLSHHKTCQEGPIDNNLGHLQSWIRIRMNKIAHCEQVFVIFKTRCSGANVDSPAFPLTPCNERDWMSNWEPTLHSNGSLV